MYQLLIGGTAGQGIGTTTAILNGVLKRAGLHVYTINDTRACPDDGHTCSVIGFDTEKTLPRSDWYDGIVAFDRKTVDLYKDHLKSNGFIIGNRSIADLDSRALSADIGEIAGRIGSIHVSGSVAVGMIMRLFGLDLKQMKSVLEEYIIGQHIDDNLRAVTAGYDAAARRYDIRPDGTGGNTAAVGDAGKATQPAPIAYLHKVVNACAV